MIVFKFGGASVKNASSVKNLKAVLQAVGYKNTLVVISAMGKTTNALEQVVDAYFTTKSRLQSDLQDVIKFHNQILLDLFEDDTHPVFETVNTLFDDLSAFLHRNKSPDYSYVYDQVVCFGELLSTSIISTFLNDNNIPNTWLDARYCIKTDNYYRRAKVDWELTQQQINTHVKPNTLYITQGFIASDSNNFSTTLGREGSDYTAAIFAYCLNANSVTIWKDVPGVLNADPRYFNNSKLLEQIAYEEAIELAFYGASVIHPKTLQPLQRKEIPLYVKSFKSPTNAGTCVTKGDLIKPKIPCYILKQNQILIALSSLDFSYIVEENISHIFNLLAKYKMKVDLIQNSAISFSVCIGDLYNNIEPLLHELKATFKVTHHNNVSLYTIRHYTQNAITQLEANKTVLLKQITPFTMQLVTQ